jgi:hypothetical protein
MPTYYSSLALGQLTSSEELLRWNSFDDGVAAADVVEHIRLRGVDSNELEPLEELRAMLLQVHRFAAAAAAVVVAVAEKESERIRSLEKE